MHYSVIKKLDIADGPGVRVTLFVSGCTNHCEGCFQPQTWDFQYGIPFTSETLDELLTALSLPYVAGLTILGGEPMEPANQPEILSILHRVRETYPSKTIWLFSGFTFEALRTPGAYPRTIDTDAILACLDVLVDGPFILAEKDLMLRFRGSRNQRLLDMPASLRKGIPVPWSDGTADR
ncbi:MAG: anaerobic ribonucleoside-triphosphate reductase activating protein [Clostridia bacterium]|nr:anaerobic ribonucleoside-triphosphate reductase activating protein [Clostridia bacterium]